jgi:hypothetical protein
VSERHRYRHCGLCVTSDLRLPAVPAERASSREPDVRIGVHAGAGGDGEELVLEEALCRFSVPGVGRYEVRAGTQISIQPAAAARADALSLFVLGTAWGALLYQRGELALHAGVVAIDGGAVAFCGPSTAGKSSTVAWFAGRGHPVLSDDLCRVEIRPGSLPRVWPSAPHLKLSAEAALRTGYRVPCSGLDPREPLPLRAVYLLEWGDSALSRLRGITALQRFQAEAGYRPELLVGTALGRNWQQGAEVVRRSMA